MLHDTTLTDNPSEPVTILLIEDNPGDIRLVEEAIKAAEIRAKLIHLTDGVQALEFLKKQGQYQDAITPDLILMDLNIPKKDGRKVLLELKNHPTLRRIPVVVLTISQAEEDILQCYDLHANCYVRKPFEIDSLMEQISSIMHFWFKVVTLPSKRKSDNE